MYLYFPLAHCRAQASAVERSGNGRTAVSAFGRALAGNNSTESRTHFWASVGM